MATSSKFDISASSPDRPLYISGQRGSHIAAPLDRSGSFRESMDNPILSSLPNMSRSTSSTTQGDLMNFFHCMRFDPKVVAAEHKSLRQGDFKRHIHAALGHMPDESPSSSTKGKITQSPSPEEIKRVKAVLRESGVKARERVKIFNEALSVFNKFFPTVPSKKRSRPEGFPADRSNAMLTSDRSGPGTNMGKIGIQNHSIQGCFEIDHQKSEERTKASLTNKRTRTSFVDAKLDGRSNALARPSGTLDRDREMPRIANSGGIQGEDRNLSIGVDSWDKSKMKKKRSGIKPDASPSTMPTKPLDGYRETKQGLQQRPATDARSKLNNDMHGFRPGVISGIIGVGKSDGMVQQTGVGMRSSIPRTDADNSPRDRAVALDKERANLRTVNKMNIREELSSASPTSNAKGNPTVRGPRSSSGVPPKSSSPAVYRSTASNDWEVSACTSKPPSGVGPNNRKRMGSARSSSPPVAHWAGQRPQKISRTARRSNLVPIVSTNDESPAMDSPSDVTGGDIAPAYTKRMPGSSPQQVKVKGEPVSSAALSESEESGAAEIKSRDKGKRSDEADNKVGHSAQKASSLVLSSRKNKLINGEDLGDGVRRQGRTGRGFSAARSGITMTVDKVGSVGTAKQLRTARHGFEKSESKAGRPPTRKLSDRKAYTRQKHSTISSTTDFSVGSDDGHDELLAAANASVNPAIACSSPFWKQMEPFFGFIYDTDITYLKQKGNVESIPLTSIPVPPSSDASNPGSIEFGLKQCDMKNEESPLEHFIPGQGDHGNVSLYQRLIAALISEVDCSNGNEDLKGDAYASEFDLDDKLGNSLDHQSLLNLRFSGHTAYNGHSIPGESEQNADMTVIHKTMNSNFSRSMNGLLSDQEVSPNRTCPEFHYGNMSIDEKLLLEIQSIGIFPDLVPDMAQIGDEEISKEIEELEAQYFQQVSRRKCLLDGLLKSASMTKEHQEKEFERRALERLTTVAYEKYIACWGPNATGKSSSSKIAKQAALAFVKRTLEQCHNYEATGRSCFSEPLFRDIFLSGSNATNSARQADSAPDGESSKGYASIRYLEGRISGSMGSHQSPVQFSPNVDSHDGCLDGLVSDQNIGKEGAWSNRVKKRELSLDDLGYNVGISNAPAGMGSSLSSSAKGKRSERDREGKGHNREVSSRNGAPKIGRPSLNNAKGERKKSKPKQKITQLSVSVNGLGKMSEQQTPSLPSVSKSNELTNSSKVKEKNFGLDALDDPESLDLSHLQIPGMDVLGDPDDLDGEGQDLGSWLNIDDEGLQDHDFMGGLEIPMDDLSDLNMMV